ncbi:Las1-domain-containing protein, partial [Calocera cornea HHB12733]
MQLPRRVPWTSRAELQHVCDWIYSPDSTPNDRDRALHRVRPAPPLSSLIHPLPARQAYTLALLRLVNGLVDPLQSGMYARPIAHIATQLGLPAWWVELRHQGTHDDLPGLAVLRLAAHEALDWLYTHYFLPTLHPSSPATTSLPHHPIPSAAALLKAYKTLSKQITRDSSLLGPSRREMERLLRAWQRWVAEVRVAVGVGAAGGGAGWGTAGEEEREREREALECVAEALLERGGL